LHTNSYRKWKSGRLHRGENENGENPKQKGNKAPELFEVRLTNIYESFWLFSTHLNNITFL
jgi:hypothetical protein